MDNEYITKEQTMKLLLWVKEETDDIDTYAVSVWEDLKNMQSADAAPVVHASWCGLEADGYDPDGNLVWDTWECSNCGCEHHADGEPEWAFCPDCGAKMDAELPMPMEG